MNDRGRIVLGLVVFLALITFPVWYNLATGSAEPPQDPEILPAYQGTQCVRDTDFMKREHMQLLMGWRNEVVRRDDRIFTAADGRRFYKSLSLTCMNCHQNKDKFCDRCHDYLGVQPYCWDCHVEPKGEQ